MTEESRGLRSSLPMRRSFVGAIIVLAIVVAVPLAAIVARRRFLTPPLSPPLRPQTYTGVITTSPVPQLVVGDTPYLLVNQGQRGANVASFNGRTASLSATPLEQDGIKMLEIVPGSIHADGNAAATAVSTRSFGRVTLTGEIIDSRCSLTYMKPAEKKVHRDCAKMCIRYGIPPMFIGHDGSGKPVRLLLVGADGSPINARVLPYVAQPIVITGEIVQQGQLCSLRADPARFQRLRTQNIAELPMFDRWSGGA
jgi:hypothetical protein